MDAAESPVDALWPCPEPLLEEVAAAGPRDRAAGLAFALARVPEGDTRPLLFVLPGDWRRDWGLPCPHGIAAPEFLIVLPRRAEDALWAMEQALRSGACAAVIGAIEQATLTQTRRLDFAAREGGAGAILLRRHNDGLSAARRRWRIAAAPSTPHPLTEEALGAPRLRADLIRRRDGAPGSWLMEQEYASGRFAVADRLADHGPPSAAASERAGRAA